MRERFDAKQRIIWISNVILTSGLGLGCLYWYFQEESVAGRVILYLFATLLITLGANGLVDFFESMIRGMGEDKTPFAESILWISPAMFTLYQLYEVEEIMTKIILGILVTVLLFIGMSVLSAAISDTSLGKKTVGMLGTTTILSFFVVGVGFLVQSIDIVIFLLPTVIVISYSVHILSNYLQIEESTRRKQRKRGNILRGVEEHLLNIKRYFNRSFTKTLWLILVFVTVSILFIKGTLPWPETISNLYTISLTFYIVLLSIITGFSMGYSGQRRISLGGIEFGKPFLGLAQMCIVFIVVSLMGIIVGGNIDLTIFEEGLSPINLVKSGELLENILSVLQVIIMEIVILSFLPTMMYVYATLEGIHVSRTL